VGVDGVPGKLLVDCDATAVGRARKNRWVMFDASSMSTTTVAAPAVYANIGSVGKVSNAVGEETVVPMTLFSDRPVSYGLRVL
jgi:hypothetical protein